MEPLTTTKRILTSICMMPDKEPVDTKKIVARFVFVVMLFLVTLFAVSAYITFVVENIKTDLEDALLTFMAFITCSGLIYMMIVSFFIRHHIPSVFQQLTIIYNASKSD